jgi:hypothetical protein
MTTQPLDTAAIQVRVDAARPGPWTIRDALDGDGFPGHLWVVENDDEPGDHHVMVNIGTRDDGEFIAHARTDVPALLARVADLEQQLANVAAACTDITNRASSNAEFSAGARSAVDLIRAALGLGAASAAHDGP